MVTPLGVPYRKEIEEELSARGVRIETRPLVEPRGSRARHCFARVSSAIYGAASDDPASLVRAALFEMAWEAVRSTEAEVWRFDLERYEEVAAAKHALRAWLPAVPVSVGAIRFGVLHALHLADRTRAAADARRTFAAMECAATNSNQRRVS